MFLRETGEYPLAAVRKPVPMIGFVPADRVHGPALLALVLGLMLAAPLLADAATVSSSAHIRDAVIVRSAPSTTSAACGQLQPGEQVELIREACGWYKVRLPDGREGYVSRSSSVAHGADSESAVPASSEGISARRISQASQFPAQPPRQGSYRVHLIDVGTGLSILIQGHDFNLLFDGGSNDDAAGITAAANKSRLLAYLYGAIGPSGPGECVPKGDHWQPQPGGKELKIQHLVLSHPHKDHVAMLDEVLRCYSVDNVWQTGVKEDTQSYLQFTKAFVAEPAVSLHTVAPLPSNRTYEVRNERIALPAKVAWSSFGEGTIQALGEGASFKVLYADATPHPDDYNRNSLVLRVELGRHSLLLMGDAVSGTRRPPSAPAALMERELLDRHPREIHADMLQVGHHGSESANRKEFLDAVKPKWALISSGPFKFSGRVLPDYEVVEALADQGARVLCSNLNDESCPTADRIGGDEPGNPGGCDNYLLEIGP